MPEGPEVERVRRTLEPWLVGASVLSVRIARRDVIVAEGDPEGGFARQRNTAKPQPLGRGSLLVGQRIESLRRHGKQLAIIGQSGAALVVHLGMTGRFVVQAESPGSRTPTPPHAHIGWVLERPGSAGAGRIRLRFVDPRRFGGLWVVGSAERLASRWAALGPDAATLEPRALAASLGDSPRPIKAALLDQAVVAGVGNIYADESLFEAGIAPHRPVRTLTPAEVERLAAAIRGIIVTAIEAGGSSIRDYVDVDGLPGRAQLAHRVYGRGGKPCLRCGTPLATATVAQRTTVWCPRCQR